MRFSSLFINRPVLGFVFNILIVFLGVVSLQSLGVRDFPAVDPPTISVSTSYAGASADVIESKITKPLEQSINGIAGIRSLTSSSSVGSSRITVEFNVGADLEAAANDVRDRVSRAMRNLPTDADNPVVTKSDANTQPIMMVTILSSKRSPQELSDIAGSFVADRLQTVPDVSEVQVRGDKRFALRLWFDPVRMAAHSVTVQDVKSALDRENVELPSGKIEGAATELTVRTMSGLSTLDDFNNLIVRQSGNRTVRLSDIGDVVDGIENEQQILKSNGMPMVGIMIIPQAGANYVAISRECQKRIALIKKDLPADVTISTAYDTSITIRRSIDEVLETIAIAFLLVVLVIFIFLRNWRATLIPVLAMPISLLGAFFIMNIAGFTINILTLLGIVLSTGLVVDDAIVVLENIYTKIERGVSPRDAGHQGSSEIFFAIISTTLALLAVMLPIVVMPGMTGRLFREFGTVVAGSVLLSAFVSLSLTPILSTRLLKAHVPGEKTFYMRTEPFFKAMINGYKKSLEFFMKRRRLAFVVFGGAAAMIVAFYALLPTELAPMEDRSRFNLNVTGPEGATYDYMIGFLDSLSGLVSRTVPECEGLIAMAFGGNSANMRVTLSDPGKRKRSQKTIAQKLTRDCQMLSGARVVVSQEQTIGGQRGGLPVQFVIMASSLDTLRRAIPLFMQEVGKSPVFNASDLNLKFNKPELQVAIDREKARNLGVSAADIAATLQLSLTGSRYGYLIRNGQQYFIIGQFDRPNRNQPSDILSTYVRSNNGSLVQLSNVLTLSETGNPPQVYHFNRYVSATVSAGLSDGQTIGTGIAEMERIKKKILGGSFNTDLAGPSRDFRDSSSNVLLTFLIALILVYLVLAAQFESFRHPLIVMFTVPLALAGALFSLWYFNQSLNIFSQIGIIILIGLVTKNGILIVEFANQRRKVAGMNRTDAVIDAAVSRFRPIVMTSLTVMLGSLPIALAIGAGATSRVSLGIVIIGGLLFSLVLSLYVIPAMYSYLAGKKE